MSIRALIAFILVLHVPCRLTAQTVVGRVTDDLGNPQAFVHVFVVDKDGSPVGRSTLTATDGTYRLHLAQQEVPIAIAFRRIGLMAEAPLPIVLTGDVTTRIDRVMRALPTLLAAQEVRAQRCDPIGRNDDDGIRALVESAREQERQRETLRNLFRLTVRVAGHRVAHGEAVPFDTVVTWTPPLPPLDEQAVKEPLVRVRRSGVFRRGQVSFWSPHPRLLLAEAFLSRFCADSVRLVDGERVTLFAHERDKARGGARWTATFSRRSGMVERLEFEFLVGGQLVGRAEHRYAPTDIGGGTIPLEARTSIAQLDPRTGNRLWDAVTTFSYLNAVRTDP